MNIKKHFAIFAILTLGMVRLDAATNYAEDYRKLVVIEKGTSTSISNDLKTIFSNENFDPKQDTNLARSILAGFYARKAFIKLTDADFVQVVEDSIPFFSHRFGFSLIHGWMLNKFRDADVPYYIHESAFSFDKFILGMCSKMPLAVQASIKKAWRAVRPAIEANRWDYYSYMISSLCAAEQVKNGTETGMELLIQNAYRSVKWAGITLLKHNGRAVDPGDASKLEERGVLMTPYDWTDPAKVNNMNKHQLIDILQTWKDILGPKVLNIGTGTTCVSSPKKGLVYICDLKDAAEAQRQIDLLNRLPLDLQSAKDYLTKGHGVLGSSGNGNRIQLMINTLKERGYADR